MEKIHGTSANISYVALNLDGLKNGVIYFFSGGEKYESFVALFNQEELKAKIETLGLEKITIYGESYGGRQQGMKATYGDKLKFIAFEVKIGETFLTVPQAEKIVQDLGLEFVHYEKVKTDIDILNQLANAPSVQAKRNGIQEDKLREGIVLRPLIEVRKNNGARIIAKHKNDSFSETKTKHPVDEKKLKVLSDAKEVAKEWVTNMRLSHVLDKLKRCCCLEVAGGLNYTQENKPISDCQNCEGTGIVLIGIEQMGEIIKAMVEDIKKESEGEIEWNKPITAAIGKRAAQLFKQRLKDELNEK